MLDLSRALSDLLCKNHGTWPCFKQAAMIHQLYIFTTNETMLSHLSGLVGFKVMPCIWHPVWTLHDTRKSNCGIWLCWLMMKSIYMSGIVKCSQNAPSPLTHTPHHHFIWAQSDLLCKKKPWHLTKIQRNSNYPSTLDIYNKRNHALTSKWIVRL